MTASFSGCHCNSRTAADPSTCYAET